MSAATEDLLTQIIEVQTLIDEEVKKGREPAALKEKLFLLQQKLDLLNENLKNSKNVLKG